MATYNTWIGRGSYTFHEFSGRVVALPFKLENNMCLLQCDAGYWPNLATTDHLISPTDAPSDQRCTSDNSLVYPRNALVLHPSGQIILPLTSTILALYKSASSLATQPSAITDLFTSRTILAHEKINFYTANHLQFRNQIDVEFLTPAST